MRVKSSHVAFCFCPCVGRVLLSRTIYFDCAIRISKATCLWILFPWYNRTTCQKFLKVKNISDTLSFGSRTWKKTSRNLFNGWVLWVNRSQINSYLRELTNKLFTRDLSNTKLLLKFYASPFGLKSNNYDIHLFAVTSLEKWYFQVKVTAAGSADTLSSF